MNTMKLSRQLFLLLCLCLLCFTFTAAKSSKKRLLKLTSIHLIDRNGLEETISNRDRLAQYQKLNFMTSQPYKKVLRIYERDSRGNVRSVVNTYYENGNPKQFLQILNARANGIYQEWHENGTINLSTHVVGGVPDVTSLAERSWIFDGPSAVWDEDGNLIAEMTYHQGLLEGVSTHYHANGMVWKKIPYYKNQVNGDVEIYTKEGVLLQRLHYGEGKREGESLRYWDCAQLACQEFYCQDKLLNGQYFTKEGQLFSEVKQGCGMRALFGKESVSELQEYQDGVLQGKVKVFNKYGHLKRLYHVKNEIKHGEEIEYYERTLGPVTNDPKIKLCFYWHEGKIQGHAKTYYPEGTAESQKEMANNKRNGVATVWYRDGNLMMIEEYEENKLVRGDYFGKGEKCPTSQVLQGKGTVTLFDAEGHFVQKIEYNHGIPDS